jgi:ElaA protein
MAQLYLEKFYTGFGFVTNSEPFLEDDILHIYMVKGN